MRFGYQVAPIIKEGQSHRDLYREVLDDCEAAVEAGADSAWLVEHHFTDYFPIPSPTVLMAHIAARFPDLGLGTCVLVTPWYEPLRLAEEIAMVSVLSNAHLHIGLGRGTAKIEYDAFDVAMEESRDRFHESLDIIRTALESKPFTYHGKYYNVPREVGIRPPLEDPNVSLYGAIGSPQSASIMGELGLPPLSVGNFPLELQQKILDTWEGESKKRGHSTDVLRPLVVGCLIADTDEEAWEIARREVPPFFALQARHYEADMDPWKDIRGYEQFSKFFANLKRLSDPKNLAPWMELQLFGSPETVARRLERYLDMGFNYIVLSAASPAMPAGTRRQTLRRFATEVAPRFDDIGPDQAFRTAASR